MTGGWGAFWAVFSKALGTRRKARWRSLVTNGSKLRDIRWVGEKCNGQDGDGGGGGGGGKGGEADEGVEEERRGGFIRGIGEG
jgi:hypothetical protein